MDQRRYELKRAAAYLATYPQLTWHFKYQAMPSELKVTVDSNWADDQVSRRSRGGGFERIGGSFIDA